MNTSEVVVIVDDNPGFKADIFKEAAEKEGFDTDKVIELYSPGNKEWYDYIRENLKEIRENYHNVVLFLDRNLGWRVESGYEREELPLELFISLVNNDLKEGDTIICSSVDVAEQFAEYRNTFFPENKSFPINGGGKKVEYKGILVAQPGQYWRYSQECIREAKHWAESKMHNIEGSSGSLR